MTYQLLASNFISSFGGILLAIGILLAMVTIHEFGHYLAGKLLGFKINEFSVGFGPAIFKKRSKKTGELFALRVIPLGGYCAFDGEDDYEEEEEKDEEKGEEAPFEEFPQKEENDGGVSALKTENPEETSEVLQEEKAKEKEEYPEPKGARFNDQKPWKRIIVLLAGAAMNYLLALFFIFIMFGTYGRPVLQVVKSAPDKYDTPLVQETYNTGLQTGDVILEINGKKMYMVTDYIDALDGKDKGDVVTLTILRDGKEQDLELALWEDADPKNMSDTNVIFYALGIACREEVPDEETGKMVMKTTRGGGISTVSAKQGFFDTIGQSFVYSFKTGGTILRSLGELLTGKIGIRSMGGPVTTIEVTAQAASYSFLSFLNIAAFIGVNLAVFNLLPIPALDGCKVIFCIIEWIRKKPINRKVEMIVNLAGIAFLFGFAIFVDVLHFIV